MSSSAVNVSKQKTRSKKAVLYVCLLLITLTIVLIFTTASFSPFLSGNESVSFTCHSFVREQAYTIMANVNLKDGMNQEEAARIAVTAFQAGGHIDEGYTIQDLKAEPRQQKGVWNVKLYVVYSQMLTRPTRSNFEGGVITPGPVLELVRKLFQATIDPATQTINLDPLPQPAD